MRFTKMHGLGNDYVYVNGFVETVADPATVARAVSDRHFGIGSDGLILILPPTSPALADCRMRMFNADGSEGEMCGNGIRCVAKYVFDHGLCRRSPLRVETGRGVLTLNLKTGTDGRVELVTVDMGEPVFELPRVPVDVERIVPTGRPHEYRLPPHGAWDGSATAVFASTGNPHAVLFVDDVEAVPLERVGPSLEHHPAFPRRANIHFAQVVSPRHLRMRTWERGSGITLACGTGASAVACCAALTGRSERSVRVRLPGGELMLEWRGDNHVLMTGPATEVFSGEWFGPGLTGPDVARDGTEFSHQSR